MVEVAITGCVADGIGDLEHILNGGEGLERRSPGLNFVYHILYSIYPDADDKKPGRRLVMMVDKLLYYGLIHGNREDYLSAGDQAAIIDKINKNSGGKLTLYTDRDLERLEQVVIESKECVWISLSMEVMSMEPYGKKSISFLEHGKQVDEQRTDVNYEAALGFAPQNNGDPGVGIFLDDMKVDSETQAACLSDIQNKHFHSLLHAGNPPKSATEQVKETVFVPCYFLEKDIGYDFLLNAYAGVLGSKDPRNLFLQGTLRVEYILSEGSIKRLAELGFNKIHIMNDQGELVEKIIQEGGNKTLMVLENVYMDEKDFYLFKKLMTVFMGCAGDNTFQDAISHQVIPLFMPHRGEKIEFIRDLKKMLESEAALSPAVANFLSLYSHLKYDYINKEGARALLHSENIYSPQLVESWQEVCKYLIKDYNAHESLLHRMNTLLHSTNAFEEIAGSSYTARGHTASKASSLLLIAAKQGYTEVVKVLLSSILGDNPAALEAEDREGNTPLLIAVREGHFGIVDALLKAGVDVNQVGKEGITVFQMAEKQGHREIAALLNKHSKKERAPEEVSQFFPATPPRKLPSEEPQVEKAVDEEKKGAHLNVDRFKSGHGHG